MISGPYPYAELSRMCSTMNVFICDHPYFRKLTYKQAGSSVFIPGGSTHGIWNLGEGELKWLYVFPTSGFAEVEYTYLKREREGEGVDEKEGSGKESEGGC